MTKPSIDLPHQGAAGTHRRITSTLKIGFVMSLFGIIGIIGEVKTAPAQESESHR